jgi:heme A synthase
MDRFERSAWGVLALNLLVILWGAVVRATGSGAGCGGHWPLCNGEVLPSEPSAATLIEYSHRASSGLALLAVVGLVILAFRSRAAGHPARRAALATLAFMLAEAAVGALLVVFELVADNRSMARAMFMATHLVNTFLLLGALALTAHFASGGAGVRLRGQGGLLAALGAGLGGLLITGTSGAVAALGDTLFPAASLQAALAQDLSPTAHLLLRLRLLHPALAVGAVVLMLVLAWRLPALRPGPGVEKLSGWLSGLALAQLAAGFVNVALLAPVWLQLVHLLLADLLWITLVLLSAQLLARVGAPGPSGALAALPTAA